MAVALIAGSTYEFELTAEKNGSVWDLSNATVTLELRRPDGTTVVKTATVSDGPGGIASYTCTTSDLNMSGTWRRTWKIVDNDVTAERPAIYFAVTSSP